MLRSMPLQALQRLSFSLFTRQGKHHLTIRWSGRANSREPLSAGRSAEKTDQETLQAMGIVEEFIARYRREQDFYEQAARLLTQTLESRLQGEGVRAIVTYRAKAVGRLEPKVRDRAARKGYGAVEDVYDDIVDLAGARVALYFPGQRDQVGRLIEEIFVVLERKEFPDGSSPKYQKRFGGYSATHYRVRLKEANLPDPQKRYADARVEIQVASVLMHAWSEVEHDLVYKSLEGVLSVDEYSVLDELNGLVMAGELALERLQRAGETRVASRGRLFSNHYELATHLLREAGSAFPPALANAALGRVDLLFELLAHLGLQSPDQLAPYLDGLHQDFERRPIAEQIIDRLLAQDASRYTLYEDIRAKRPAADVIRDRDVEPVGEDIHEALGAFLSAWIDVERFMREHMNEPAAHSRPMIPSLRLLDRFTALDARVRDEFERVRRLRNNVVHGIEVPAIPDLLDAARFLRELKAMLDARLTSS
jgi:ppGpp synthetase/RelA/SpoT-type nucleotidyltranferase